MIWFSVGNLLVFNYTTCTTQYPIVVFTSFVYIAIIYVTLLLPIIIRITFLCCPPDINNLPDIRGADREQIHSSELTETDRIYWKRWLIQRGCVETTYKSLNVGRYCQDKDICIYDNCPVCLLDFDDVENQADNIINFPCSRQHYFHDDCLFQWLNASRFRRVELRCPYCRQSSTSEIIE